MSEKNWGDTVVGWFIVRDEDEAQQKGQQTEASAADLTADELIAKYANSSPSDSAESTGAGVSSTAASDAVAVSQKTNSVPASYGAPPTVNGRVDFDAVFEAGGVDADERERIAKAKSLLESLPESTDVSVKKQIVEASLKAFGVPIEKIIEAGVAEIEALEFYIRSGASDTEKVLQDGSARIQQYEQEIQNLRRIMEERVREQNAVVAACNAKKLDVQKVLEFFGRDKVAQVVKDSPKLHEPGKVDG
ncbi:MAG: hypothetical protein M3384_08945 [Acidobacteriota bacterium]|nr:hypothetical protein [Acidobacteriota bacterium]